MHAFSSSRQQPCGNMPATDGQWRSSRIVSTNRVLNKHYARSVNTIIKRELGSCHVTQSIQQAQSIEHIQRLRILIMMIIVMIILITIIITNPHH